MARKKSPKSSSKRGRERLPLSRERVLQTAVRMADESGINELSMRGLAQELGVEVMSLYHHVKNKDDVLDGLAEIAVGEIAVPAVGGEWKSEMRKRAASAHEVFLRHPWGALLVGARLNIGPNSLRYVNATLGCLREAGFSWELADRAWNAMDSHIYGFTIQELNFPLKEPEYATAAASFVHMLPVETHPYMRALTELVAQGKHRGVHDFFFGLDLLLDGLEGLLEKERAASSSR